jgi:hypothetical protein
VSKGVTTMVGIKQWIVAAGFMLVSVNTGHAAAAQCVDAATQELVAEIVECGAYYSVMAWGAEATPGGEVAVKTMKGASRDMIERGQLIGEDNNISQEATGARLLLHTQNMVKIIGGNTANWPILILRYKDKCDALHTDSLPRLKALLEQECR